MATGVTVDFNANLTRFTSALDKATSDLSKFQSNADRISANIGRSFAGLGVGLSAGAFTAWIKGAIDSADALNDLGKSTSLTVEQLSGLKWAAQLSGTNLETTAKAVNKLSVEMGKDAEKFAKIGITAKDPIEALKQLSDVFTQIQDPQQKAAFAAAALGKQWEEIAPLLAEGGESIGKMVAKGQELYGITGDMAEEAAKFNDQLDEMKARSDGLAVSIGGPLVKALNGIIAEMQEGIRIAGGFGNALLTFGLSSPFGTATEQAAKYRAEIERLEKLRERSARHKGDTDSIDKSIAKAKQQLEMAKFRQRAEIDFSASNQTDAESRRLGITSTPTPPKGIDQFIKGADDSAKKAAEKEVEAQRRLMAEMGGVNADYMEQLTRLTVIRDKQNLSEERYIELVTELIGKQPMAKKLLDEQAKAAEAVEKADIAASQAHEAYVTSLMDGLQKLKQDADEQKEHNDRLGMSKRAIAELDAAKLEDQATTLEGIAIKRLDKDLDEGVYNLYKAQAAELRRLGQLKKQGAFEEDQLEAFKKSAEEAQKITDNLYENIQRNLGDEMFNMLDGNFKSIGDSFKRMLLRMVSDAMAADVLGAITGKGNTNNLSSIGTGLLKLFGGGSDATGGPVPYANYNAKGGAYDSAGRVQLFAKGGAFTNSIVSSPTLFKFAKGAGMMGEAGPEAIMPLRRGPDGSLGVQSNGGSGKTVVINQTNHFESGLDKAVMAKQLMDLKERTKAEVIEEMSR